MKPASGHTQIWAQATISVTENFKNEQSKHMWGQVGKLD